MVASDWHSGTWSRLKSRGRVLFGIDRASDSDEGQRQSKFQVEPLEPRILLSGDPIASELARLVDDATHAMFLDDQAAVVEQLTTDVVADAGHADYGSQDIAVSAGDERGVEWPSEWTRLDTVESTAQAGQSAQVDKSTAHADRVDLQMVVANLVAAFAAQIRVDPAAQLHFIASVANRGPPTATGPPSTIEIERADSTPSNNLGSEVSSELSLTAPMTSAETWAAGLSTNASVQTDPVQTLLKGVLDKVLAAFAEDSDGVASQISVAGLEIRMAKLAAGEVARIDGNVILIDDDAGGAGWSLDGLAAADLASLAILVAAPVQPVTPNHRPLRCLSAPSAMSCCRRPTMLRCPSP